MIFPVQPAGGQPASTGEIRVPLSEWTKGCKDAWMARELESRAASADTWRQAAGAGIHARLLQPENAEALREAVQRLLRGEVDDTAVRARRWAKGLSQEQIRALEDQALHRVQSLFALLDALDEEMAPSEQTWRDKYRQACLDRDDVEGVLLLLTEAGAGEQLRRALGALDRRGTEFVDTLPTAITFEDERLLRVSLGDPEAWWAQAASPDQPNA